jgi:hypothetical protein
MTHEWTDEDAAHAAVMWAAGSSCKDIARLFGERSASGIGNMIKMFLLRHSDMRGYGHLSWRQIGRSKVMVADAVINFRANREWPHAPSQS